MKSIIRSAAFLLALFAANLLHAQLNNIVNTADLAAIEGTTPLAADQLPPVGTFYSAANPSAPPLPGNILGESGWDLGNLSGTEIYLLDDLAGSSGAEASFSGGFQAMDDSDPLPPGTNSGAAFAFTNTYSGFPTGGLSLRFFTDHNG